MSQSWPDALTPTLSYVERAHTLKTACTGCLTVYLGEDCHQVGGEQRQMRGAVEHVGTAGRE
jgi:hypothetical protein